MSESINEDGKKIPEVIKEILEELINELPRITNKKTLGLREEDVEAVFKRALAKCNEKKETHKAARLNKVGNWKESQMNSSITQLLPKFEPLIKAINDLYEAEESWKNAWEKEHPDQESDA